MYSKRNSFENKSSDNYMPALLAPPIEQFHPHVFIIYLFIICLLFNRLKVKAQDSYHNRNRKEKANIQSQNQLMRLKIKKMNIFITQHHLQQYFLQLYILIYRLYTNKM